MRLRHRARVVFAAAAAAAVAAGLGTVPALAAAPAGARAGTWTVTPGGDFLGDTHDALWELVDLSTGMKIKCAQDATNFSDLLVRFKSGSGLVNPIAKITAAAFPQECTPAGGPSFNAIPGGLPWPVRALNYDASRGETTGAIHHFHLALTGPACSAVIDGTSPTADNGVLPFSWFNGGSGLGTFAKGSNLRAYDVTGCSGFLGSGDPVRILAGYNVTSPVNPPPTITSP